MADGVVIIIPARWASSRLPGKPLVALRGAGGATATLIERTWRLARLVRGVRAVHVATDDARIADAAAGFGADVVMTSSDCVNGTERCADAVARLGIAPEVVVNLQGDSPLVPPAFIEASVAGLVPGVAMATPVMRCDDATVAHLRAERAQGRVGATTAVCDARGRALYFSKEVLPHGGGTAGGGTGGGGTGGGAPVLLHLGVYAFRPEALAAYRAAGPCALETAEGLEQLRFLHHGMAVHCVPVDPAGRQIWELNNPEDIARIEAILAAEGTP